MDMSAESLRDALHRVDVEGWDGAEGRELLALVRRAVVAPVVRRSGLRGPAADQAEATGWEAAWDALRRPSARTAQNPGGMVWVAVRRAVASETDFARMSDGGVLGHVAGGAVAAVAADPADPVDAADPVEPRPPAGPAARTVDERGPSPRRSPARPDRPSRCLSLDDLMDGGWQPAGTALGPAGDLGPVVAEVLDSLVAVGWDRADAADAIAIMADHAGHDRSGSPTTRWRWVSLRLGVPEWQARRLAALLLGGGGWPGVIELVVSHGSRVVRDPAVRGAVQSTTSRWSAAPSAWLAGWDVRLEGVA
jgi:hypothetical protein